MSQTAKKQEEREELGRRLPEAHGEIRVIGDPVLHERAVEISSFDRALHKLARRMIRIMHEAPGVGLAATQLGVLQRVLVYDLDDEARVLVNPVLSGFADETEEGDEACLSVPGIAVPVERPVSVRVRAFDADGEPLDYIAEGFEARVIQHEHDHLEGVLIVDRTSRSARAAALRELAERRDGGDPQVIVVGGL
jgi:peptide deformylase